jgi:hypothetical protein
LQFKRGKGLIKTMCIKNILVIFLLLSVIVPSFAQQKLSHADSLVLARVSLIGPWMGTYYINKRGIRDNDPDAPLWPMEVLMDSFAEKSLNPNGVFDFIEANIKLLYKNFGDELYLISVTDKEIIWIKVIDGKPVIFKRDTYDVSNYYLPSIYYIKRIPEKHGKVKRRNK